MNCKFFAAESDKINFLEFLFTSTNLQAFDNYSPSGQHVRQYKSVADIRAAFDLTNGGKFAVVFQLWAPEFLGALHFTKISLNPKYCKGHTFGYCTTGLGLIQLSLGGEQNSTLHHSHIGHFSEKGATGNEQNSDSTGAWDWVAINRISRHLKYTIHQKMADGKLGGIGILPGATERQKQGIFLQ